MPKAKAPLERDPPAEEADRRCWHFELNGGPQCRHDGMHWSQTGRWLCKRHLSDDTKLSLLWHETTAISTALGRERVANAEVRRAAALVRAEELKLASENLRHRVAHLERQRACRDRLLTLAMGVVRGDLPRPLHAEVLEVAAWDDIAAATVAAFVRLLDTEAKKEVG